MMLFQPLIKGVPKSLNPSLLTYHLHDVPEAEQAGPLALAGGDLQVAGHAAAVHNNNNVFFFTYSICYSLKPAVRLCALERGFDQAVGHRVVPVVRVGQELQALG